MGQWPPPQGNFSGSGDPYQNGYNQGQESMGVPQTPNNSPDPEYLRGYYDGVESAKATQNNPTTQPMGVSHTEPQSYTNPQYDPWSQVDPDMQKKFEKGAQRRENLAFIRQVGTTIVIGVVFIVCLVVFLKNGINPSIPTP